MKINFLLKIIVLISFFVTNKSNSQNLVIEWQKKFGGSNWDIGTSIKQTSDGGFIMAVISNSNDINVSGSHGNWDYWIVKLSSSGIIQWQKTLGGSQDDTVTNIITTLDGGYLVSGYTQSNDGDVSGNHGGSDSWIVKLSSSGTIQWQKTLGGSQDDFTYNMLSNSDGSYLVVGNTYSNNGDVSGNHGNSDSWIVKLSSSGTIQWQKTLGGSQEDSINNIISTSDGGYLAAGTTSSNNGDVSGYLGDGSSDSWIVKLSPLGIIQWQKTFGGLGSDSAEKILSTLDGGYLFAGNTDSNDGDVTGNHGGYSDYWLVKLSSTGVIQWQKTLGGTKADYLSDILIDNNGNYFAYGCTKSNYDGVIDFGDVTNNHGHINGFAGYEDLWLVKLNSNGNLQWQKTFGGFSSEYSGTFFQTLDEGIITIGRTNSSDGDLTDSNYGNLGASDCWVMKLIPDNLSNNNFTENITITLFPNPTKEKIILKLNYFTPSQEITITNIQGKIIHTQKLEGLSTTINTSSFEKGIYFLNLTDGTQKTTKKFIIE